MRRSQPSAIRFTSSALGAKLAIALSQSSVVAFENANLEWYWWSARLKFFSPSSSSTMRTNSGAFEYVIAEMSSCVVLNPTGSIAMLTGERSAASGPEPGVNAYLTILSRIASAPKSFTSRRRWLCTVTASFSQISNGDAPVTCEPLICASAARGEGRESEREREVRA